MNISARCYLEYRGADGVTGQNVNYVVLISTVLVIVLLAVAALHWPPE
jgi:hypothetical protein